MVIMMQPGAAEKEIECVEGYLEKHGLKGRRVPGETRTVINIIGDETKVDFERLEALNGVDRAVRIQKPYKLASREYHPANSVVEAGGIRIGEDLVVIAGPCTVESRKQMLDTATEVRKFGASMLRGGAYKPRTSPYSFQGMGKEGLEILKEAKEKTGLPVVSEVMCPENVGLMEKYVDVLQVGSRNMQNFDLLKAVGKSKKPVLLKRGMTATIEEFLLAAEYILSEGNKNVVLCERGIRTFENMTRNTLDLAAVPLLKRLSHLPVIVDPSHATGNRELVIPMAKASVACGADGIIVEVHPNPEKALCDGAQSLKFGDFEQLMKEIGKVAAAVGRKL